jgi:hypothetical protein
MLKPLRHCACCGTEMASVRSTKAYCSDACRKKASRGGNDIEQQTESRCNVECLRRMDLVAKIWPVYSWDDSPSIFALMVPLALDELNPFGPLVIEGELERALRDCGIETSRAGERVKAEIKSFYDARKDRRIKKGYTPSDNGESAL